MNRRSALTTLAGVALTTADCQRPAAAQPMPAVFLAHGHRLGGRQPDPPFAAARLTVFS